mmetsp:Transcript_2161/g.7897  ORF Transcript_2161/g.7897 Transcript_2161/m.7897 type:complete len:172 (-) Transcript_2161:666-1181(-)
MCIFLYQLSPKMLTLQKQAILHLIHSTMISSNHRNLEKKRHYYREDSCWQTCLQAAQTANLLHQVCTTSSSHSFSKTNSLPDKLRSLVVTRITPFTSDILHCNSDSVFHESLSTAVLHEISCANPCVEGSSTEPTENFSTLDESNTKLMSSNLRLPLSSVRVTVSFLVEEQ